MKTKLSPRARLLIGIIVIIAMACSWPGALALTPTSPPPQPAQIATPVTNAPVFTPMPLPTNTPVIVHTLTPSSSPQAGALVYDVESSGTAPEKRAPYGDSYDIYRLERPFKQDMTYIPDMDIVTYNVRMDDTWIYVSIELIGTNPNNELGIQYGVELDLTGDGFGEYIIWANPPYSPEWSTDRVQVFEDKNHDTGGFSAEKSDAPFDSDGYETKIFDSGVGDDPDTAWVRINAGARATVQFAFKKSMAGSSFLLGVLSDAGLKDVTKMFYNDRFTEEEAGSPIKSKKYYPLKALYLFDNACREAFNFQTTGYEPQLCPRDEPEPGPKDTPKPGYTPRVCIPKDCVPPNTWDPVKCYCIVQGPY